MLKKISILLLGVFVLSFNSCLDENPQYTTNSKVVYNSEQSAQLALNGLYGLMAVQGSFAQLIPEINTEASGLCWTSFNPSDNRNQYTNGVIPVDNEFNNLVWGALYQAIANCNIFIENCNASETQWISKQNMIAQAKFLRGVCYYSLLTFYGGVPIRLTPSTLENIDAKRASRQEVITQIMNDWTEAALYLGDKVTTNSSAPIAPSKYSAHAYMAKLYWLLGCNAWAAEQGDTWANTTLKEAWPEMKDSKSYFEKAKLYGDSVLTSGGFDLEPNFNTLYNGKRLSFSKEFVFAISTTGNTTENVAYNSLHWTFSPQNSSQGETWGRSQPNKSFYDWAFGTYQDDPRLKATFISKYVKFANKLPSTEIKSAYPYVMKSRLDTIGWKDSVLIPGLPTVKFPITKQVRAFVDSIDYRNSAKYKDPTNPELSELDSLFKENFAKTKGASWNIDDWPYFGKYMTNDCHGRYANNNLYVYRFADFLLLMADVENELGNTAQAVALANRVLQRARNSAQPASTYPKDWNTGMGKDKIRQAVFHERLFELAAEYDGFIDTRRRGINWRQTILERNNNHHITKACYEYGLAHNYSYAWREYWYPNDGKESWQTYLTRNQLLPIPRMEMSSNDLIGLKDQNPGY